MPSSIRWTAGTYCEMNVCGPERMPPHHPDQLSGSSVEGNGMTGKIDLKLKLPACWCGSWRTDAPPAARRLAPRKAGLVLSAFNQGIGYRCPVSSRDRSFDKKRGPILLAQQDHIRPARARAAARQQTDRAPLNRPRSAAVVHGVDQHRNSEKYWRAG